MLTDRCIITPTHRPSYTPGFTVVIHECTYELQLIMATLYEAHT